MTNVLVLPSGEALPYAHASSIGWCVPSSLSSRFATALRKARAARELTQAEVAELVGMAPEAYGRLERGGALPRAQTLRDLATHLRVSTDALLGLDPLRPLPAPPAPPPELRRLQRAAERLSVPQRKVVVAVAEALAGIVDDAAGIDGQQRRGATLLLVGNPAPVDGTAVAARPIRMNPSIEGKLGRSAFIAHLGRFADGRRIVEVRGAPAGTTVAVVAGDMTLASGVVGEDGRLDLFVDGVEADDVLVTFRHGRHSLRRSGRFPPPPG